MVPLQVLIGTVAFGLYPLAKPGLQENLYVGVGVVHVAGIGAALRGLIGPIEGSIAHLVLDTLIFLNSIKLLRLKIKTLFTPQTMGAGGGEI
jgi:hypothetical protein